MHSAFRVVATASIMTVLLQALPASTIVAEPTLAPPETTHTFTLRTYRDAALTEWALARFERAGLQLPPLAIGFHDDKPPCVGNFGFYRSGSPDHIDICLTWNRFAMAPKKTMLHELAHAWTHHNLTQDVRQRFLHFRGLSTWADEQTPWEEKGFEQAAEIIAWALLDRELHLDTISDADPPTLAQAYELLTSSPPPAWGRTPLTVIGATSREEDNLVYWAVNRFKQADLILPPVDLVFDPSGKTCEAASTQFSTNEDEIRVALCTRQEGLTLTNRFAILRVLGHAWSIGSVPIRIQTTFLDSRRLETWNDPNQAPHLRGVEHAADIIAWALMDQEVEMSAIKPNDFNSLEAGYSILTGKQPALRVRGTATVHGFVGITTTTASRLHQVNEGNPQVGNWVGNWR